MKLHPLSLLLLALWFSSVALFVPQLGWLLGALLLSLCFQTVLNGFAWPRLVRQLRYMLPLCIMILIIQLLFGKEGALLWGSGWYGVHAVALQRGLAFSLRLLILWSCAQALIKLSYEDFDLAFSKLHLPEELGFMTFHAVHIIPAMNQKLAQTRQLLLLRGISLKALSLRQKLGLYKLISLGILAEVLSRSAIQAIALELRGFRSSGKRSRLYQKRLSWRDLALLASVILLSCCYFLRQVNWLQP